MEDLTKVLFGLVTEWRKCAWANNSKRCKQIVATLRIMGYTWPRCCKLSEIWDQFVTINAHTITNQVHAAFTALQSDEEKWFTAAWTSYNSSQELIFFGDEFAYPRGQIPAPKIDYTFMVEELCDPEIWAKDVVDEFGAPLL